MAYDYEFVTVETFDPETMDKVLKEKIIERMQGREHEVKSISTCQGFRMNNFANQMVQVYVATAYVEIKIMLLKDSS